MSARQWCDQCGNEFAGPAHHYDHGTFCSVACKNARIAEVAVIEARLQGGETDP